MREREWGGNVFYFYILVINRWSVRCLADAPMMIIVGKKNTKILAICNDFGRENRTWQINSDIGEEPTNQRHHFRKLLLRPAKKVARNYYAERVGILKHTFAPSEIKAKRKHTQRGRVKRTISLLKKYGGGGAKHTSIDKAHVQPPERWYPTKEQSSEMTHTKNGRERERDS